MLQAAQVTAVKGGISAVTSCASAAPAQRCHCRGATAVLLSEHAAVLRDDINPARQGHPVPAGLDLRRSAQAHPPGHTMGKAVRKRGRIHGDPVS